MQKSKSASNSIETPNDLNEITNSFKYVSEHSDKERDEMIDDFKNYQTMLKLFKRREEEENSKKLNLFKSFFMNA